MSVRANRRGRPPMLPIVMAVGDVGGRLAGGIVMDTAAARCQTRPL